MTRVAISAVHTFPACNLNSDDNGAVKSMTFGGTQRVRVSSQAWKASVRENFRSSGDASLYATRTKRSPQMIIERAVEIDPSLNRDKAEKFLIEVLSTTLKSKKSAARASAKKAAKAKEAEDNGATEVKEEILTDALFTISDAQVDAAARVVIDAVTNGTASKDVKDVIVEALSDAEGVSGEQALFGRFFADEKKLSIDAACQVAHAMGTCAMPEGFDYFTARDDLLDGGDIDSGDQGKGAAHLGVKEFSSGPLYRYAVVDVDQLTATLGDRDRAIAAALAFVNGFVNTVPRGAQNSFTSNTVPDTILVEVGNTAISYAPAFEDESPTVRRATRALTDYASRVKKAFGVEHAASFTYTTSDVDMSALGTPVDMVEDILDGVRAALAEA